MVDISYVLSFSRWHECDGAGPGRGAANMNTVYGI